MKFESLSGKTLNKVATDYDKLTFYCSDNSVYELVGSEKDWGSECRIEDITEGYEDVLSDSLIVEAYMSQDEIDDVEIDDKEDSWWTFYRIITTKGTVVIRWYHYCESPYYSSEAYFNQIKHPQ